jgi:hypothetical protein
VFDARIVRTYLILAVVIAAGPLIGLFASSVTGRAAKLPVELAVASTTADAMRTGLTAPADAAHAAVASATPTPPPPTATAVPLTSTPTPQPPPPKPPRGPSLFANRQVVAFYGSPISAQLGVLGRYQGDDLVRWLKGEAGIYDSMNGDRGVVPAIDLIYAQVQSDPTDNGLYLRYLDDSDVQSYIQLAEQNDLQVILDLQIGRGDVLTEVQKVQRFLENPRVHVAIDPEYAVGPNGIPIQTPGVITGEQINAVQLYLSDLGKYMNIPPKVLVIHQYMDGTVIDGGAVQRFDDVDLVLNMDAFGSPADKLAKYQRYASEPYAEHRSYNVFLQHDWPVQNEQQVMNLDPQPDMVEYQ